MTSLLERFIPEARDYLEQAASCLLKLERDPSADSLINDLFRSVHTLKGASGLFDIPSFTRLVHAAEDVLVAVREQQIPMTSALVDLLLDSLDQVSAWVDALDGSGGLPPEADGLSAGLSQRLRVLLPQSEESAVPAEVTTYAPQEWLAEFAAGEIGMARAVAQEADMPLLALDYMPDEGCFYRGEDPVGLVLQLTGLQALRIRLRGGQPDIAGFDPFRAGIVIRALVVQPRQEVEHLFRYVADQMSLGVVSAEGGQSAPASGAAGPGAGATAALYPMALRILGEQIRIAGMGGDDEGLIRRIVSVEATAARLLTALGWSVREGEMAEVAAAACAGNAAGLIALLTSLERRLEAALAPAMAETSLAASAVSQIVPPDVAETAGPEGRPLSKILKVDQAKVDSLMNLIAELVVSKNSLPFLARRAEEVYGSRDMGREIKDQYAVIDRLAQEMQRAIMDVRMLPVSEVFERFPRLVRDISRKLGKTIDLKISGEDTAADKTIIESLSDPLIHLVRNAMDHGIETPEQRRTAGKSETATLHLRAWQEGDQVMIEVADDGRGINADIIRAKAVERDLLTAERAAGLGDQEAINLIFLPGFSTASKVSDLSGRGVGMDVVRTAIEKVNGQVMLTSEVGRGTSVRLSLPLSMAVTRVMMVEVGRGLYGLPMDGVVETVKIPASGIRRIKQAEAFVLRDAIVPLVRMHQLLEEPKAPDAEEEAVLVARVGGSLVGLVVDRFREGIDVILKPMDGILAGIRGYSGSALLGDGRVLLVLNLKELL